MVCKLVTEIVFGAIVVKINTNSLLIETFELFHHIHKCSRICIKMLTVDFSLFVARITLFQFRNTYTLFEILKGYRFSNADQKWSVSQIFTEQTSFLSIPQNRGKMGARFRGCGGNLTAPIKFKCVCLL